MDVEEDDDDDDVVVGDVDDDDDVNMGFMSQHLGLTHSLSLSLFF
jgi:hypothetical protein